MTSIHRRGLRYTMLLAGFIALLFSASPGLAVQTVLFQDDFSSGNAARWQLDPGWQVASDGANYLLTGSGHSFARPGSSNWSSYSLKTKVRLVEASSALHLNYRSQGCERYFIGFNTGGLHLSKTYPCDTHTQLAAAGAVIETGRWYSVEVSGSQGNFKVYLDGVLMIDYTDPAPILNGATAFEVLTDAPVQFDDVVAATDEPLSPTPWVHTGGPLGGLGYDVRISPANKKRMYVTDNYAGVGVSDDGGENWLPANNGITIRGGNTGDAINIFSLTVDPNNPDIVWAGTFGEGASFGVFKSTDGGASWTAKTSGMTLDNDIAMVFRGFTVQNGNSNVVYAQAEIPTTVQGWEFNRVKGRVYKTTNGGESWQLVWQGNNLARYLIIDPGNPELLYLSTGIFDREAFNSDCAKGVYGGLGVLKSANGGLTWSPANSGLTDLYVGSLRMHPANPQILFAATGSYSCTGGDTSAPVSGLFRTSDGGASWTKVLGNDIFTTVNFSPSSPDTVYAGSAAAFYRSQNGGQSWSRLTQPSGVSWGPPGVRAGVPIDVTVDPTDPLELYANNYGGGVFRSRDGAESWSVWSRGFSGADVHQVHIPADSPSTVLAIGRSGPFKSANYGVDWTGIANGDAAPFGEWNAVATDPAHPGTILISDEHQGVIFLSADGGASFSEVLRHPDANADDPAGRQGFKALAFAPTSPGTVYAGLSKDRGSFLGSSPQGTAIYKSQNGGGTFAPIPSLLDGVNVRNLVVDPANANTIWAATTNGVYRSIDGAQSWSRLEGLGSKNIETLAIDPLQPGFIVAGEIFGGIWKSTNGGATWSGPLNSGFDSPNPYISALVLDPVHAGTLFAGDLYSGVYRSQDAGENWAPFPDWKRSGMTIRAVKDLAISAKVMYAATQGGGVFRFDRLYGLTLSSGGTGSGSVASSPAGISCGAACSHDFASGAVVNLSAMPASGSSFSGWSGACAGAANPCLLTMNADKSVSASFESIADFSATPLSGQAPLAVSFTDRSKNSPTSWLWNFGDSTGASTQNPAHLYQKPGQYTVKLTATGASASQSTTKVGYITVSACPYGKTLLAGGYRDSLQSAYGAAASGNVIKMQAVDLSEALSFNLNKAVTLRGGHNCDFTGIVGKTTFSAPLTIRSGKVVVDRVIIR